MDQFQNLTQFGEIDFGGSRKLLNLAGTNFGRCLIITFSNSLFKGQKETKFADQGKNQIWWEFEGWQKKKI